MSKSGTNLNRLKKWNYAIYTGVVIFYCSHFAGCTREQSTRPVPIKIIGVSRDTTVVSLKHFKLSTDSSTYGVGQPIRIAFEVSTSVTFDETLVFIFKFSTQEQFAVKIYRDSTLILTHPKVFTFEPSGFILRSLGERKTFTYVWDQKDDFGGQVVPGEYLIEGFLLENNSPVRSAQIII